METKLTKNEKGITLVALIITIIILLILAVVSIRAITGDNILGKSETAKEKYESAKKDEADRLGDYTNAIQINESKNSNNLNIKYYKEESSDFEIIYKISGNQYGCYVRRNNSEEKYKKVEEDIRTVIDLETKVMINDDIHYYSKAAVIEISDPESYESNDIVINNIHYTTSDIILISSTEMIIDPNPWYYKEKSESEIVQSTNNRIANFIENFDESLLSEEIFKG